MAQQLPALPLALPLVLLNLRGLRLVLQQRLELLSQLQHLLQTTSVQTSQQLQHQRLIHFALGKQRVLRESQRRRQPQEPRQWRGQS